MPSDPYTNRWRNGKVREEGLKSSVWMIYLKTFYWLLHVFNSAAAAGCARLGMSYIELGSDNLGIRSSLTYYGSDPAVMLDSVNPCAPFSPGNDGDRATLSLDT